MPDYQSDPIFLLGPLMFFSRYTVAAGFVFALFDPTSFLVTELTSFYFCYILIETIAKEIIYGRDFVLDEEQPEPDDGEPVQRDTGADTDTER